MAGDWIKMRVDLRDDPNVFKLADQLNIDELHVVGCLFSFWAWIDKHAVDGRVDGATSRLVDKVSCMAGFCDALVTVGWLQMDESGASIPNFERHIGESAKERGLKNARQSRWRANKGANVGGEASTPPSTDASTREEKRREEISITSVIDRERTSPQRGSRLPTDWTLPSDWADWAKQTRPDLNPAEAADRFADYWHGVAGAKGRKADWQATWRNWVRAEKNQTAKGLQAMSFAERDEQTRRRRWEEMTGREWPESPETDPIDMQPASRLAHPALELKQ